MSSRAKKPVKCQSGSVALARYRKILAMVKAKHPRLSAAQHRAKAKKLYKTLPPLKGFTKVCKRGAGFEQDHPILARLYSKSSPAIRALQMLGGRPKFKPISNEETKRMLAAINEEVPKINPPNIDMRDDNLDEGDVMDIVMSNPVPELDLPDIDEEVEVEGEDYEAPMVSDFNLFESKPKRARKPKALESNCMPKRMITKLQNRSKKFDELKKFLKGAALGGMMSGGADEERRIKVLNADVKNIFDYVVKLKLDKKSSAEDIAEAEKRLLTFYKSIDIKQFPGAFWGSRKGLPILKLRKPSKLTAKQEAAMKKKIESAKKKKMKELLKRPEYKSLATLSKKLAKPKARKPRVSKPKAKAKAKAKAKPNCLPKRESTRLKKRSAKIDAIKRILKGGCMQCMGSGCMECMRGKGGSQLGGIMGYDYDRPLLNLM